MSIYDQIDDDIRDDVFAAAEQFERMSPEQVASFTSDLESINSEFDSTSDIVTISIGVSDEHGITGWKVQHHRRVKNEQQGQDEEGIEVEIIETVTRGTPGGFGETNVDFLHPPDTPFNPQTIVQAMYDTLIDLIGKSETALFSLTTPPTTEISLYKAPETDTDIFTQQGTGWNNPIVVTEEMREPDADGQVDRISRAKLPESLSQIDAGSPMSLFTCDREMHRCSVTSVEDQEAVQTATPSEYDEYEQQLVLNGGERARGIAVITNSVRQEKEEWKVSKVFHSECGPTASAFEAGEDSLALLGSKEKDEVYFEGTVRYGPPPSKDEEIPHQPVFFEDITILARRGEYAE